MPISAAWPAGRQFAFTIFDDTDWATVERVKPVYALLADLGMRTTKSVWLARGGGVPVNAGSTCEDREYLAWVRSLQSQGFEIGLHNVAPATSRRDQTRAGLDRFRELFGERMIVHANHTGCRESIYWGAARLTGWRRTAYRLATRGRRDFRGDVERDPLFWGDLCRERVQYVRNFVFDEVNCLSVCPEMPYHDPAKPYVNFWFTATNGSSLSRFLGNLTVARLQRLIDQGGLCLVYVHFAAGYARDGVVDAEFRRRMEFLAASNGWFAPVSDVLDFLRGGQSPASRAITPARLRRVELRWLTTKALTGTS